MKPFISNPKYQQIKEQRYNMKTKFLVGLLTLSASTIVCEAITGNPSATGFGWDDYNTSTLNPAPASYLNATPNWFNQALPNSVSTPGAYNNSFANTAQWTFTLAGTLVPAATLNAFNYSAWVVNNDAYNLPNGNPAVTRTVTGDVGGANYTLNYMPGANDPGGATSATALASVHFIQVLQINASYGNDATGLQTSNSTTYCIDNLGNAGSPFYDVVGGSSGYAQMSTQKWMDDTPYTTEDKGGYGNGQSDTGPIVLSETDLFDTFIAVDMGATATTQNNVLLYGGQSWGYTFSASDVPEPGILALTCFGGIAVLIGFRRLKNRQA
jgi:hypothetical protein